MTTIYLVEDDPAIRELVIYTLKASGYQAEGFAEASAFFSALHRKAPALVLLDIMLPGDDGLSVLKTLRAGPVTKNIPVIMLTAKSAEYDKVLGLDLGADDYIAKPFGMMELVARIRALLRRAEPQKQEEPVVKLGQLELNLQKHTVTAGEMPVVLTLKEFEVLKMLMQNNGMVFTREQLLQQVWGYSFEGETRTVDVHIRTLRQKLGSSGEMIETVRGVGYRAKELP